MNEARPDLNLLAIFDAIARHGSVTAAAQALNLSQPAVSHALARLRDVTGDPLFLRGRGRLQPTPRAQAMAARSRLLVAEARALLAPPGFDPAESRRSFRLAASDYAVMALVPVLLTDLNRAAPHLHLTLRPVGTGTLVALREGGLEMSFWAGALPEGPFLLQPLFTETLTGLCPPGHAFAQGPVAVEDWAAAPHVAVSLGDPGVNPVEQALAQSGLRRRVALVSPSFAGAMAALAAGGMVMALPRRLLPMALAQGLRPFDLPIPLPPYPYGLLRHQATRDDPGIGWLAARIAAAAPEPAQGPLR